MDDPMVNCISQPIKLDDLVLITEPRSLTELGDVSVSSLSHSLSHSFDIDLLARSIWTSGTSYDTCGIGYLIRWNDLSSQSIIRSYGLHTETNCRQSSE